jgi:hypothetical protein
VADGCCNPLGTANVPAGPVSPLRGTYYVDPLFAGTSTGSEQNPFKTYAAAIAAGVALALTAVTIFQAPGTTTVENITLPTTGEWTLVGLTSPGNLSSCQITGNVAFPATASRRAWLRDLRINGNVTGNTSAGVQRVTFERVAVTGTTTLTVSGAGVVRLGTLGGVPAVQNSISNMAFTFLTGAVAIQGTVWADTTQFGSTLSCSGRCSFSQSQLLGNVSQTNEANDNNTLAFESCLANGITFNLSSTLGGSLCGIFATDTNFDSSTFNFSGAAINLLALDVPSALTFQQHGATLTGAVVNGPGTLPRARLTGQVNNIAAQTISQKTPIVMMRMNAVLTLTTPGTAGNAVLNAIYTDSIGVVRTKAVTPALNVAGAAGDEVQGSLQFTQNGTGIFQWSVTGITTPGALAYNVAVSLEPAT